ncbi:MAG: hypothetical protein HY608_07125 [Planctomycetes bacterium]|nr:hypothetical protein [Planctomycetota bacterium]
MGRRGDLFEALSREPGRAAPAVVPARPAPERLAAARVPPRVQQPPGGDRAPGGGNHYDLLALVLILLAIAGAVSVGAVKYLRNRPDPAPVAAPRVEVPRSRTPAVQTPRTVVPPLQDLAATGNYTIVLSTYTSRRRALAQEWIGKLVRRGYAQENFFLHQGKQYIELCYGRWPRDPQKVNDRNALDLLVQFQRLRIDGTTPFRTAGFLRLKD